MSDNEAEISVLHKPQPRLETLGDGNQYTIAPTTLALLDKLEQEASKQGTDITEMIRTRPIGMIVTALWLRLQKHHPELTREGVGELVNDKRTMTLAQELFQEIVSNLL